MNDLATQMLEWLKTEVIATVIAVFVLSLCCCGTVTTVFWNEVESNDTQAVEVKTFEPGGPSQEPGDSRPKPDRSPQEPGTQAGQMAPEDRGNTNPKRAEEHGSLPFDPTWVEPQWIRFQPDEKCPQTWSALVPRDAPGASGSAGNKDAKERVELDQNVTRNTYVMRLPVEELELSEYDVGKGAFTAEVPTLVECPSGQGVQVALAEPKVVVKQTDPRQTGEKIQLSRQWHSEPFTFAIPMSQNEAIDFQQIWDSAENDGPGDPRDDFEVLVAFRLDTVRIDRDRERASELLPREGAGPILVAERQHVRVTHTETQLLDTKQRRRD